jgi:hypothetical protein
MTARWADCVYWSATILAGLIAALVVATYFYNAKRGEPIISIAPLVLAGSIWLIGWAGRHALAED